MNPFFRSFLITVLIVFALGAGLLLFMWRDRPTSESIIHPQAPAPKKAPIVFTPEFIRLVIEKAIPRGFDTKTATVKRADLNSDGREELILCAVSEQIGNASPKKISVSVVTPIDNVGNFESVGTGTVRDEKITRPPCAGEEIQFADLTGDGVQEFALDLGYGGAYVDSYGIFSTNFSTHTVRILTLKEKDGAVSDAIVNSGASVQHALTFAFEDANRDGGADLVLRTGIFTERAEDPTDPKNWQWEQEVYVWDKKNLSAQ